MPTGRGWAALGAAAALGLVWVGFGERELLAASAFLIGATLAGMVFVRTVAPRLSVRRKLAPVLVHDGDRALVEMAIDSKRSVSNLAIEDQVEGLGSARFAAARIQGGAPLTARYEVLCRPRGIYRVGPAQALVNDPLGLAEARSTVGGVDRLVVYPAVEDLDGYPIVRGQDPSVQTTHPTFSQQGGEDFFTLREYQSGDDLRMVHWPSSAKRDDLMIKQLEIPWQSRALVLLDHRSDQYETSAAFEHSVRGAASVVRHLYQGGFSPELWTLEPTPPSTLDRYRAAMERLATVQALPGLDLYAIVTRLRKRASGGGALVMVTGEVDEQDLAAFRTLSRDFSRTVVLSVGRADSHHLISFRRVGAVTVSVGPDDPWAPAWSEALEMSWSTALPG